MVAREDSLAILRQDVKWKLSSTTIISKNPRGKVQSKSTMEALSSYTSTFKVKNEGVRPTLMTINNKDKERSYC